MITAYIRVSTTKQHIENQKEEIAKFAKEKGLTIQKWKTETVSGTTNRNDRCLGSLIRKMQRDDILIVSEISRLSRTMLEIMAIFNACAERGIRFYSIKEGYQLDSTMNSKIIGFAFSLAAEIERNLISSRTREALAHRKASGMKLGRPNEFCPKKKILEDRNDEIRQKIQSGQSLSSIARQYHVARNTLYDFLKTNNLHRTPDK